MIKYSTTSMEKFMQERLNEKHETFYEIMTNASKSDNPVSYLQNAMKKDSRVATIIGYALNPRFKMPLPDSTPPYIPSQHPIGVAPVEILNTHNKLYIMYNKDTKQYKKEEIFVQWLEDMAPQEAELMLHIKNQTLDTVYPNMTKEIFVNSLGWSLEQFQRLVKSEV
jgi:hypothetical protein